MIQREKYINPFTDFGFKRLFGSEFSQEILSDFLTQILGGREHIASLTYLNTEKSGRTKADRRAVFDLYCENEKGEKFIIELQNVYQQYFKDRSLYYATFPIQEQARKGKNWDYDLKAVYTIAILNFSFPDVHGQPRYRREIQLLDKQTFEVFYEKLTFIYLEVPKFDKNEDALETRFDKWMFVLKHLHRLQSRPVQLQEKIFERFFKQAEIAQLTPAEMKSYEESLKVYRDRYSVLQTARQEGRQAGWNEGRQEERITIARQMKQEGDPIDKIARITGLSKEELEKL